MMNKNQNNWNLSEEKLRRMDNLPGSDFDIDRRPEQSYPNVEAVLQFFSKDEVRTFLKLNAFECLCNPANSDAFIAKAKWCLNKYLELGGK